VEESTTLEARKAAVEPFSVEESTTLKSGKGGKPPIRIVGESSTHIEYHSPVTLEAVAARRARLRLAVVGEPISKTIKQNQIDQDRVAA
jgi:hypothetical protein